MKSLSIGSLNKRDLVLIRKKVKRGFEEKLTLSANKRGCLDELSKVFPRIKNNLSLIGLQELIEVVNRCQKK